MIYEVLFRLILLHGAGDQDIWINPGAVASLRERRDGEHFAPGIRCVINTSDGKIVLVMEGCTEVEERIK